mmetsp:Transcript_2131/g.3168  ORF Transcript_2131/g.3168 Transcript_2131/m.3168 type:complete len:770 (-) Transcript_2131:583-2892(-)
MVSLKFLLALFTVHAVAATEYFNPTVTSIDLEHKTLFTDKATAVHAKLEWGELETPQEGLGNVLYWKTLVDGAVVNQGEVKLNATNLLPSMIDAGNVTVHSSATYEITVSVSLDNDFSNELVTSTLEKGIFAISSAVSLIPLIVVVFFAILTNKVEVSLFVGVCTGTFIIYNLSIIDGFKRALDTYIIGALTDGDNQHVILFTLFLSGLVGMMEKSAGVFGLTHTLKKYAKTPMLAQLLAFMSGYIIMFDDYANCLACGATMRPILDLLMVSREKLAFIVDSTAAPVAALIPVSSWAGFEINQINRQLQVIIENNNGVAPEGLTNNAFALYLDSIPYRFYPILMIVFMFFLIISKREFGPMLTAERKVRVFERLDGGDGAFKGSAELKDVNMPEKDTPARAYNMLIPLLVLIFLLLWVLVQTGIESAGPGASFADIFKSADSYSALLLSTMGASIISLFFYMFQYKHNGSIVLPPFKQIICHSNPFKRKNENATDVESASGESEEVVDGPKAVLSPSHAIDAWLHGVGVLFPAIIVLTLAWAAGDVMTDIGADRVFSQAITSGSLDPYYLPTVTFILSMLLAVCLGSSWGVMIIMYSLVLVPAWESTEDAKLFSAVIGAILSGATAGDHISYISDTSVLSAMASQTDLTKHVVTQAPYALTVSLCATLCGFLPVGLGGYSAPVGILVGSAACILFIFALGVPVICKSGRFDPFVELYLKVFKSSSLEQLKKDTVYYAETGIVPGAVLPGSIEDQVSVGTKDSQQSPLEK